LKSRRRFTPTALVALAIVACVLAGTADARHHGPHGPRGGEPGQFDYYLLTLSWSPTYCLTHPDDRYECGRQGYGFVLHGLWPQYQAGGYPEHCATGARLDAAAERAGLMVYVSPQLMYHEWQAHGTCSGLDAATYFRAADRALASVRIPAAFEAPRRARSMTARALVDAFRAANPQLPENAVRVACSRGELAEVRICLNRDLSPRACGRAVRSGCGGDAFDVPATR